MYLRLKVGDGPGSLKQAPYHRRSGTDTLVFRYPVNAVDLDTSGITVAPGTVNDSGERNGILGPTRSCTYSEGPSIRWTSLMTP